MLKDGFGFNIHRKKYRSQITNQRVGLINYLTDPTLDNVSRLFVLALENEDGRTDFKDYYTPTVKTKDYNVLIDQELFFEFPVRNKE